ncbi:MAG: TonB-dependent receptor [Betaproteobacteria bacterium]|nr:TonB-dependent receptor [Betaproteobacteria bacterium]
MTNGQRRLPNGLRLSAMAAALIAAFPGIAAETASSPVVVTATREERPSFDLPVSIDVIEPRNIQFAQPQVNASESLVRIPGITANNRSNFAQDPQIQTRGFGARSQFGVRGIRIYQDGIPLSTPDGQGQASTFALSSAKAIEVMRGPFSALYGNSAGGIVQIFTRDGGPRPDVSASTWFGSYNTHRENLQVSGSNGRWNYVFDTAHFESDGYRDFSAAKRDTFNVKFGFQLTDRTKLTWTASGLDQPVSLDPQGLTLAEYQADRKQAAPSSLQFRTRVERSQYQTGAVLDHLFENGDSFRVMAYAGNRSNLQFLAGNQFNLLPGASQIKRDFAGTDMRYTHRNSIAEMPVRLTAGMSYEQALDDRSSLATDAGRNLTGGLANLTGSEASRRRARDEDNDSRTMDFYAQGELEATSRLSFHAGVRHSQVRVTFRDRIPVSVNPIGSGTSVFNRTLPVAGVVFKVTPALNWYANYGTGFETPTSIESAFSTTTGEGPNLGLKPATSQNYETGLKAFLGADTRATLAVFHVDTKNEIIISASDAGRNVHQNGGRTRRKGVELSVDSRLNDYFNAYLAYTWLDATYLDNFTNTGAAIDESGNRLPGTARNILYGEIAFSYPKYGFFSAIEARHSSRVFANDANTDIAAGYTVANLRLGFTQNVGNWTFTEFARVDNLFDKEYIGSVRVNNAAYIEAAPTRNGLVGFTAKYNF